MRKRNSDPGDGTTEPQSLEVFFVIGAPGPKNSELNERCAMLSQDRKLGFLEEICSQWHSLRDPRYQDDATQGYLAGLFGEEFKGRFGCGLMYFLSPDRQQLEAWYERPQWIYRDRINRSDPGCLFVLKGTRKEIANATSVLLGRAGDVETLDLGSSIGGIEVGNGWTISGMIWSHSTDSESWET